MQGSENILAFGFLMVGIGLFLWSMLSAAVAVVNRFQNGDEWIHGLFAVLCVPLLYDLFISNKFAPVSGKDFVYMTATIGVLSLIVFALEFAYSKVKEESLAESLVSLVCFGGLALFVLWRLYDIIMVREHFWVLILPIGLVGGIIFAALFSDDTSSNSAQVMPPERNPIPHTPPQKILPPTEALNGKDPRDAFDVPPQRLNE